MIKTIDVSKYKWTNKLIKTKHTKNIKDCNYKFFERIGSPSGNGEVFVFDENLVIKIVLFENIDEIQYSIKASNLVLNGLTTHFLTIYDFGTCEDTIFSDDSKIKYRSVMTILNSIQDKDISSLFNLIYENCNFECMKTIYYKYFGYTLDLPTRYIISNRCYCDLQQYYKNHEILTKTWKIIIKQILDAIDDLQRYMKLVHNDIKFENILVDINEKEEMNIIVHDFGDSYIVTDIETEWRKIDVYKLFSIILIKKNIPKEIHAISEKCLELISKYNKYDIIDKLKLLI